MTQDHQIILDAVAEHTGQPASAILADAELADVGLDSLKFLLVLLDVERRLKRKVVDIGSVGKLRTMQDLLDLAGPGEQFNA